MLIGEDWQDLKFDPYSPRCPERFLEHSRIWALGHGGNLPNKQAQGGASQGQEYSEAWRAPRGWPRGCVGG